MTASETLTERYQRYSRALADRELPAALLDLDAVERNLDRMVGTVRGTGKTLRLATKSLRSVELLRHLLACGQGVIRGLMTYSAAETAFLHEQGLDDLLLVLR